MEDLTQKKLTIICVSLWLDELQALKLLEWPYSANTALAKDVLADSAARGMFPSNCPEDWRKAIRAIATIANVNVDQRTEDGVIALFQGLSSGELYERLKDTK